MNMVYGNLANLLLGEGKEEWGWQVERGEQVMPEFACVANTTFNKSSGGIHLPQS